MASKAKNSETEIDVEEVLVELEHKVERLKILYEQYFMGIEKIEPQTARKEVSRKLMELSQLNIRNTALRYRFHAINQKFSAYHTYWGRTLREIENGTYFRNVARASREAIRKGQEMPDELLRALPKRLRDRIMKDREVLADKAAPQRRGTLPGIGPAGPFPRPELSGVGEQDDSSFEETFEQLFESMTSGGAPSPVAPSSSRPATRGAPAAKGPPAARSPGKPGPEATTPQEPVRPGLPPGMDEDRVRELHRRYVSAQRALGDPAEVRYEQILSTVMKQGPKILAQHGARAVEFGVLVKDGKVILKATPRK